MPTVFSPFVKELLDAAIEIATLYTHSEVKVSHFLLALLKHHRNNYVTGYLKTKLSLVLFERDLFRELETLPTTALPANLEAVMEKVLKDAYNEAVYFKSDIILPEYFFLAILKNNTIQTLDYQEARAFVTEQQTYLIHQHQEINWAKQAAIFQLIKGLDRLYENQKINLQPYLHYAMRNEIRNFVSLLDVPTQKNKITIEIIENIEVEQAIEQTMRFLVHRKYPIKEAFLYRYATQEWTQIKITAKEIIIKTENTSCSELLALDLKKCFVS